MVEVSKVIAVNKIDNDIIQPYQDDFIAVEMPVALIYNGISHVVMMTTPKDLVHFAIGFSLTEGIIQSPKEIYAIDIQPISNGIEIHIELSSRRFMALKENRRNLSGRTGCGICGTEQINAVCRVLPPLVSTLQITLEDFKTSLKYLKQVQSVGSQTGCTHAAVWLNQQGQFIAGFEDIGRHVALDKLLGYRATQTDQKGVMLVSSRASYEMVQKVVQCGIEVLFSVSATTSMAVTMAQQCNLTLVSFFHGEKGVIYTGSHRIKS